MQLLPGGPMHRFWKSQAICKPYDPEAFMSFFISSLVPIYVQTATLLHHPAFPRRGMVWTAVVVLQQTAESFPLTAGQGPAWAGEAVCDRSQLPRNFAVVQCEVIERCRRF